LIIGRNTDYPLNGYFDAHPTVIYFAPTDCAHRYMTITSAGFHNAGVVGFNSAGLYAAIHTVPARVVSASGLPAFMIGQQVLRSAGSFAEAEALLGELRPAAGWSYHLVSTRERRAATFEICNGRVAVRPAVGDRHVTTNHWTRPEMAEAHLFVNATIEEDSRARAERAETMLAERYGRLDAQGAAEILADKVDPRSGRIRTSPNTIATHLTVSSSVWLPDQSSVFVASGRAPTSQGTFVRLPTVDVFDPATFGKTPAETLGCHDFAARHPGLAESEQLCIQARQAFEYRAQAGRAAELLARAAALDTNNASVHVLLAMVAIRADDHALARRAADAALAAYPDGPRTALAHYLRGRLLGAAGDREAALADLRTAAGHVAAGQKLVAAARRAERKLGRSARVALRATDIAPMMLLPDAYRYDGLAKW
jgi:tetratricopeptide (TPR) repeat protein